MIATESLTTSRNAMPGTRDEKHDVFVLLFKNDEEEIKSAFEPYYKKTELLDETSSDYLEKLFEKILNYDIITKKDIDDFAKVWAASQ